MTTPKGLEEKFWKALDSDRTVMLGFKDDPQLTLLRFDAERAEIWADASSVIAGVKILLGIDPKKDYRDKVAEVRLG